MDGLTRAAVAGTSRETQPEGGLPTDYLFAGVAGTGPERNLLLRAGARAVYRAAGRMPETGAEPPVPAPEETLPPCSANAAEVIRSLLTGRRDPILREALDRLRLAGLRLPPALLPDVLNVEQKELRSTVAAVLGKRGCWLATLNPEWGGTEAGEHGAESDETVWGEGALPERLDALRRVRGRDANRGRLLVEDAWKSEKAEARAAFVEALGDGMSLHDEPFLERALDDRSVRVREAAAALLARLPGSAHAERMLTRADAVLVRYEPAAGGLRGKAAGLLGRGQGRLVAEPPGDFDASWKRDLPGDGPTLWRVGEKARSIVRAVETIPPEHWEERFGLEPAAIIAAIEDSDWEVAVLIGWSRAAASRGNRSWALPLWERCYRLGGEDAGQQAAWDVTLSTLIGCVDQNAFAKVVSRLLDGGDLPELLAHTFLALPGPWNEALSSVYSEALREHARNVFSGRRVTTTAHWPNTFRVASERLSLSCLDGATVDSPDTPADRPEDYVKRHWLRELEKFEETLELRRKIVKEIPL